MKKLRKYLFIIFISLLSFNTKVSALTSIAYINIEDNSISYNGKDYSNIKEYTSLEDFLVDYNAKNLPEIYITDFLFDGVSSVKNPNLDDFIDNNSNDTKIKTLEIKALNINTTGDIELTGTAKGYMIAVNTNNLKGNINLILNNVNIDTDTKKAPAIFVYNKETTYTDCKVTIITKENTKNYIEGGKFKKVSLLPSDDLDAYKSYYTGSQLSNYEKYSSYYGIYSASELNNILFATVKADNEDLNNGDPYLFYKGSGAISSDIDLYFEGKGYLKVISKNKEGIETKGNLTFSGGTGDYEIHAHDDCLNTTAANSAGNNVRNTLTIDVNSLIAIVDDDSDAGDAIDSNGTLIINGGKIYAFAHSSSNDSGLDSEDDIYINGGTIISTGNMADAVSSESKQKYLYIRFNTKIDSGTIIVIKNQDDNIITAFKTTKTISTLLYSADNLNYKSLKVYANGEIEGQEENGLYTEINSYTNGEEISYQEINMTNDMINNKPNNNFILNLLIVELVLLTIDLGYILIDKYLNKKKIKNI